MHWRRISLPLLLLTVSLAPVDGRSMSLARATSPSQVRASAPLSTTTPAVTTRPRRQRRQPSTPAGAITPRHLYLASRYLAQGEKAASAPVRQAWESFFSHCDSTIRRFAASRGLRGGDLDDCAQDVWADLLKRLPTFELDSTRGRFESWLYRVVASKTADLQRNSARRARRAVALEAAQILPDPGPTPSDRIEREEIRHAVRRGLEQVKNDVSDESYQVLCLRQLEGWDVDRVAGQLGLTPSQVWAREHRTKRKLAGMLTPAL